MVDRCRPAGRELAQSRTCLSLLLAGRLAAGACWPGAAPTSAAAHGSKAVSQLISRLATATPSAGFMPAGSSVHRRNVAAMVGAAGDATRGAGDRGSRTGWESLAGAVRGAAAQLSAPPPASSGFCAACRIPVPAANARCYPCGLHAETLPGLLADAVVPICYAVKGSAHAGNLWLYKSARPGAAAARTALRALLFVFLRDHGRCVWRAAGMARPTRLAVVPSGRGRGRPHPLQALAAPCLALPLAPLDLRLRDEPGTRELDADRFAAAPLDGADVLLLDDTWTTGASAQSACAALRLAGARSVAIVVLGRHVYPDAGRAPAAMPFRPGLCAVHARAGENGQ